ncbi:MAG TPA: hypothetical protein ENJ50_03045 [Planctomycetaceae bacterium]|nr:hypothetical protein [Planctomycetaceae bacterium]
MTSTIEVGPTMLFASAADGDRSYHGRSWAPAFCLAILVAITAFGCTSGRDSPNRQPRDLEGRGAQEAADVSEEEDSAPESAGLMILPSHANDPRGVAPVALPGEEMAEETLRIAVEPIATTDRPADLRSDAGVGRMETPHAPRRQHVGNGYAVPPSMQVDGSLAGPSQVAAASPSAQRPTVDRELTGWSSSSVVGVGASTGVEEDVQTSGGAVSEMPPITADATRGRVLADPGLNRSQEVFRAETDSPGEEDSAAAGSNDPLLLSAVPDLAVANVGDVVRIRILLEGSAALQSTPFKIRFNPSVLRFEAASKGSLLSASSEQIVLMAAADGTRGTASVGLSAMGYGALLPGTGELCILRFKAVGTGSGGVSFSEGNAYGATGVILPVSFQASDITIR